MALSKSKKKCKVSIVWLFIFIIFIVVGLYLCVFYKYTKIRLNGSDNVVIELNSEYKEQGVEVQLCTLLKCNIISKDVDIDSNVDVSKVGAYKVIYNLDGKIVERNVNVVEYEKPVISLNGEEQVRLCPSKQYVEEGYSAVDNYDGDISDKVERIVEGNSIFYKVVDSSNNANQIERKLIYEDVDSPVINLNGDKSVYLKLGTIYDEPGYSVIDNCDGNLSVGVIINSNVDVNKVGTYEINYEVKDAVGNVGSVTRKVIVYDPNSIDAFKIELDNYIKQKGYNVSIGYKNLRTGVIYNYQSTKTYYGASLIKTLDALYVYEKMELTSELKNLVKDAISVSSNSAHQSLVKKIGFNNLKQYGVGLGAANTLRGSDNFGNTTVKDQMVVFEYLYNFVNSRDNGAELKSYFINDYCLMVVQK